MVPDTWMNVAQLGGLQQALDALPPQGGTVYVPSGTYQVPETLHLALKEGQHLFIVGDGRSSVLVNTDTSGAPLMHLVGVEGSWWPDLRITIRDLTFFGTHDSGDALVIEWPNDTMVDGCAFFGHGGKAIYLKHHGTNATIRDCWMRDCKRGVYAEHLHHLTLHGNQTRSMKNVVPPWLQRRLEPGAPPPAGLPQHGQEQAEQVYLDYDCRENRIVNNHFAYGHAEGIILDGTAQHVIANNCIEGFTEAIYAANCRDIVINANYLHSPKGVHLVGECHGLAITNNTMINNAEGGVVIEEAGGSGGHVISGNVMRKSVYDGQGGVCLGDAANCVVTGNLIEDVSGRAAISAGPGGGHLIADNRIARNDRDALAVECATNCQLSQNLADEG